MNMISFIPPVALTLVSHSTSRDGELAVDYYDYCPRPFMGMSPLSFVGCDFQCSVNSPYEVQLNHRLWPPFLGDQFFQIPSHITIFKTS